MNKAIIISRRHPYLNFGQTVTVLEQNRGSAVIRADGDSAKYTIDISYIWPYSRAYEYEAYNEAITRAFGWPWQNKK